MPITNGFDNGEEIKILKVTRFDQLLEKIFQHAPNFQLYLFQQCEWKEGIMLLISYQKIKSKNFENQS